MLDQCPKCRSAVERRTKQFVKYTCGAWIKNDGTRSHPMTCHAKAKRYTTELTMNGHETFLLDESKGGETVAVFVRNGHEEEAKRIAEWLNAQSNQEESCRDV